MQNLNHPKKCFTPYKKVTVAQIEAKSTIYNAFINSKPKSMNIGTPNEIFFTEICSNLFLAFWGNKNTVITMASGWESGGLGLEPWRLKATFDPSLPQKITIQPKDGP